MLLSPALFLPLFFLIVKLSSSWGIFFVTRPPKGGCCNPPPWNFYTELLIPLYLLPAYRYGPPLSIDTNMSTIELHITSLWSQRASEIWIHWKYTLKLAKINFSLKNRRNMGYFAGFFAEYVRKWWFSST